jgi:hypothetical protein
MGLEAFRNFKFRNTTAATSVAQAFTKRKYLYDTIVQRCEPQQRLEDAAASLDRARGTMTMTAFHRHLHAADESIVRRRRRRDDSEEEVPRRRAPPPLPAPRPARRHRPPLARRRPAARRVAAPNLNRPFTRPAVLIDGMPAAQFRAQQDFRTQRWQGGANQYTGPGRLTGYDDDFL